MRSLRFSNLKIGVRLALSIWLILLLMAVVAATGWIGLQSTNKQFTAFGGLSDKALLMGNLDADLMSMGWHAGEYVLTYDDKKLPKAHEAIDAVDAGSDDVLRDHGSSPASVPGALVPGWTRSFRTRTSVSLPSAILKPLY